MITLETFPSLDDQPISVVVKVLLAWDLKATKGVDVLALSDHLFILGFDSEELDEVPLLIKDLDSVIKVIADQDVVMSISCHIEREVELAFTFSCRSETLDQLPVMIDDLDPVVSCVADDDVDVVIDCNSSWIMKQSRGFSLEDELLEDFSLVIVNKEGRCVMIADDDVVVMVEGNAPRLFTVPQRNGDRLDQLSHSIKDLEIVFFLFIREDDVSLMIKGDRSWKARLSSLSSKMDHTWDWIFNPSVVPRRRMSVLDQRPFVDLFEGLDDTLWSFLVDPEAV